MGLLVLSNSNNRRSYSGSSLGDKASTRKKTTSKKAVRKAPPTAKVTEFPKKHISRAEKLNERFRKFERLIGQKYYAYPYQGKNEVQIKKLMPSQLNDDYKDYRPISNGLTVIDKWFSRWFDISLHDFETKPMEWIEKKLKKARTEMKIDSPLVATTAHETAPKKKSEAKPKAEPKPKVEAKPKAEPKPSKEKVATPTPKEATPIKKVEMTEADAENSLSAIEKMLQEAIARKVA